MSSGNDPLVHEPYMARVSDPGGPFTSIVLPLDSGLALSLYRGGG